MQAIDLRIRVHGWTLVQVVDGATTWCYTVGLVENHGHPELVLFDVRTEDQQALITPLVDLVVRHGSLPPTVLAEAGLRVGQVHVDHLESDLFGTWANRYGELPRPGDMLHIRLPDSSSCPCHAASVRRLDLPGPLPPLATVHPAPNRAERRPRGHRGPST